MRIVFIGTVELSLRALEKCLDLGAEVSGVVTRQASAFNADFADMSPLCAERGVPVLYAADVNTPESLAWIRDKSPDVIFCFGWSSLLKSEILALAPMGVIGFHPAALPRNRGRHPLVWALALGLKSTATTFFFMDEGVDSGDILSQEPVAIAYEDDAQSLYEKVTRTVLGQIETFLPLLASGNPPRTPQDHAQANAWRKRGREDGRIDFRMSSRSVYNLVRALARPYPGAHVEAGGKEIKVWRAREIVCEIANLEPGKVLASGAEGILVKCGESAVLLAEHEFKALPQPGEYLR